MPLRYGEGAPGDPPVLAVRVQQMFGATETPTVAGGRVPVTLHLLSPADRPVQVTSDLAGFWAGSWHDVRKDMAGRYPKHDWPEDPEPGRDVSRGVKVTFMWTRKAVTAPSVDHAPSAP